MEELIARVTQASGLDQATAKKAIGIILGFLKKEGPPDEVNRLFAAMPGAEDAMVEAGEASGGGGGLMGMVSSMGGGVMALGGQLMAAGVSMGQMQPLQFTGCMLISVNQPLYPAAQFFQLFLSMVHNSVMFSASRKCTSRTT